MTRLLAAALILGALPAPAGLDAQFLTVHGRRIDTVAYDFTGDGKPDILNTSIDFDVEPPVRWLALHPQDAQGKFPATPTQIWSLDPRACALCFGDFLPGGGVEAGFFAPDGAYVYPWGKTAIAEDAVKLLHTRTYFAHPSDRSMPVAGWRGDLNNDGRDDLIVPTPDGYKICFQTAAGRFGKVSAIEADVKQKLLAVKRYGFTSDLLASLFTYQEDLPRVTPVDLNGDGLVDLVSITGNVLTAWHQRQAMEFRSALGWSRSYRLGILEEEIKKDTVNLSSVAFADINADRNLDLIVTKVHGELGLFDSIKTTIYLCFGNGTGDYSAQGMIKIDGVSNEPQVVDMNGDGCLDLLTSRLRTDIVAKAIEGGILGDIRVDYEVFQFDPKKGRLRESPVYSYPVAMTLKDIKEKGAASRPMMHVTGDFSGDGRPDQVRYNPKTDTIEFHEGRDTGRGDIDFTPMEWQSYKPERPPKYMVISDVSGDGLADLLLVYAGQVGLLISKPKR